MSVILELEKITDKMNANPAHIENEKDRIFQVELKESGPVQIVLKEGKVHLETGHTDKAEVKLKMNDQNFSSLLKGNLNTTVAFMTGGLKVEGNIGLALKLQEILKKYQ
ncbi:SCP2 sterol-binding domain-containing protein [Cytobacillus horneckiae]|uniref:Sterol carrier protein n=1 Tax=Cytobacillus horneckiae TaxID=549687 RepID=A0A2N0ZK96_9BACI|nr:SCP2 sterol-binding domain-containing protein [Cytobacillus horneckiae]NRG46604.1 SCP2 sterol-binding domain-containing protein [Bacillus sp. CRN 9]MCM3177009.1 SCP2 sterol-binding domain-containing protein [Cytobacillus horneckiae]MEC1154709.1 SCP2 sterol-binding domain-containing protein [Cytobacillus horneckiae]MED2940202.1 SCP2 sterol-binding domain-containing protein [Cytobacillus horneckiae]PKG29937.1 sterol carrier protein [Cytobacillus horneckiae]